MDWTIAGTGPDGEEINVQGTATDGARRGDDGIWRYIIDNPFGTAIQAPGTKVSNPDATALLPEQNPAGDHTQDGDDPGFVRFRAC